LDFQIIQKLNTTHNFNLWVFQCGARLKNDAPLPQSTVPAAVSTAPITASTVPATSASTTALTTDAARVTTIATAPLSLVLPLSRKGIRADITK